MHTDGTTNAPTRKRLDYFRHRFLLLVEQMSHFTLGRDRERFYD